MPKKLELHNTQADDGDKRPPLDPISRRLLESRIVEALREVFDPEIPLNVYDLGLIYEVSVNESAEADILMTLTSPMCPVAEILPGQVGDAARGVAGVAEVRVELTWDPPFSLERMSEEARLTLGLI